MRRVADRLEARVQALWRRHEVEIVYRLTLGAYLGVIALLLWGLP